MKHPIIIAAYFLIACNASKNTYTRNSSLEKIDTANLDLNLPKGNCRFIGYV